MSRIREEFSVIPRRNLGISLALAGAAALLILALAEVPLGPRIAIAILAPTVLLIYVLLVSYVYGDSKRRGMRPVLWTLVALFVPNAIGIIAYFIVREPVLHPCPSCGTAARREFAFCPSCGITLGACLPVMPPPGGAHLDPLCPLRRQASGRRDRARPHGDTGRGDRE